MGEGDSPAIGAAGAETVAVVIPVFNDWESLAFLLPELDATFASRSWMADVILVDDGSILPVSEKLQAQQYRALRGVQIIRLRRNLGHQRAIAVGLTHLFRTNTTFTSVVVMDGDGEDSPDDVPVLVERQCCREGPWVIFAARSKRLEHWTFRLMYNLYRITHLMLTGVAVKVGNFSAMSPAALHRLVVVSELWNHYAAAVTRSRIPIDSIPIGRRKRYSGKSQMSFAGLVLHGLSAISVFSDVVGARLLVCTVLLMVVSGLLLAGAVAIRLVTNLAIPGWATNAVGILVMIFLQSLLLIFVLTFITLGARSQTNFVPLRDTPLFIDRIDILGHHS